MRQYHVGVATEAFASGLFGRGARGLDLREHPF